MFLLEGFKIHTTISQENNTTTTKPYPTK